MSGGMSRRKGATAERAVVRFLRAAGFPDARRYLAGDGRQPGDIDALPGVSFEVKNQATYDFPAWLRQAVAEAGPNRLPVVVAKPNGVPVDRVGDWWAVMRFSDLMDLLREDQ